uniref:Uncharacterized protein n=1 Tax=Arundo donax TaxID=35708 RepID=A0A0A9BUF3_ARUDO
MMSIYFWDSEYQILFAECSILVSCRIIITNGTSVISF